MKREIMVDVIGMCGRMSSVIVAVLVAMLLVSPVWAEIDLMGESHMVIAAELGESFVNSSETMADLTIEAADATTFSGSISGNIRLVKTGSSTLGVTTVNNFTGGVDLQAGTINFTVAGSLGNGTVTIASGATLNLAAAVECANPIHLMANASYVKFTVSSGTAIYSGDIDGEAGVTGFSPYSSNKNASPRFRGAINLPNAALSNANSVKEGWMYFDGVVSVKSITHTSDNKSGFYFSAAGNSWNFVNYNVTGSNKQLTFARGAIPSGSYITQTSGTRRNYTFNVSGEQSLAYFTSDNTGKVLTMNGNSSAVVTLASETELTGKAQKTSNYKFTGNLSLVYAPQNDDSAYVIGGASASTMNGGITVARGIFSVEGTATFASVTGLVIGAGAKFSCTSTGTTPLKSVKSISLASDATLELGDGIEIVPDAFLVGGTPPAATGWFTGADNENPVEGDQQTLSQLKGAGRVYIPFQGSGSEATWDGEAGADTLVTTAENWAGDVAPDLSGGGVSATFATGGSKATFTGPSALKSISFTSADGFELAALGDAANVTLAGGVSVAANSGAAVITNTIAVPVTMNSEQSWVTPANTILELRAPLGSESSTALDFGGAGTYCIYSTNTFTGSISLTNGLTRVYSERGAFGAAEVGSRVTLNNKLGARLTLYGTTIEKDFRIEKTSGENGQGGLTFASSTRNVFAGKFTADSNWAPEPANGTSIVFEGGGSIASYFRPDLTGSGTSMTFSGAPYSFGTGSRFYGRTYYVSVSSNTIDQVYIRVNTTLNLQAPFAFKNSPNLTMANESGNNPSYIYISGCDQSFGNLAINNPNGGFIASTGRPATLAFAQTSDMTPRADLFQGPISLSKGGSATVTIGSRMQTTGGNLSVTGGTLAFTANGSLASVTNVSVSGASSVMSVASRDNLPLLKTASLSLSDGGKVEIAEGVSLRVASLTVDGEPVSAGVYTAATLSDAVSGDGSLHVGKIGTCLIIW